MKLPIGETIEQIRCSLRNTALRASGLDEALEAAVFLGWINWHNNDGHLTEEALEVALVARHGSEFAAEHSRPQLASTDWLHVISTALEYGGHTRLLKMLVTAQKRDGKRVAVAVTQTAPKSFYEEMEREGVPVQQLEGTLGQRAKGLFAIGKDANRIVLHIHPDDAGAALVARKLRLSGKKVLFVNHADHCFSYGPGAADVCLELSGFGSQLSIAKRSFLSQSFMGIPVQATAATNRDHSMPVTVPTGPVLSIGSSEKYKPGNGYDFPSFVSDLLSGTDASMEIVGPSDSDPWWAEALCRYGKRLQLLGLRSYEETSARLANACAYVDSFPMPGGTAFPQALMAGKTVFGIRSEIGGYSLADTLRYSNVESMREALTAFLHSGEAPESQAEIRERIAKEFNAEACASRLQSSADGELNPVPSEMMPIPFALDHYAEIWRASAWIAFPRKMAKRLPFRGRLALIWACRDLPPRMLGLRSRWSKGLWALKLARPIKKKPLRY